MKDIKIFLYFLILFSVSISPLSAENIDTVGDIETIDNVKDVNLYNDDENEKLKDSNPVYYFNASANVDGDGSKNNPYKYLRDERLPYGVTAYFADGVYEINSPCTVYSNDGVSITSATQVTFIGQSMENTIIKYVGNASIAIKIPDLARLFVSNMTFNHATIENRGTLDGTNVAFINNHGVDIHANLGYNNSFGGAIYSQGLIIMQHFLCHLI